MNRSSMSKQLNGNRKLAQGKRKKNKGCGAIMANRRKATRYFV
tara:strand:+ start:442 stop:570 length:129 start_codon:yes stop_codon:yes gene_type:complete